ncbi:MAG: hypothetical protein NW226_23820 [Microscillaceae bacterium]|nr:hypothetical protein [Microscillaceae bacterium]
MPKKYLKVKNFVILFITIELLAVILLVALSFRTLPAIKAKNQLVRRFSLTDYCLSTESRHTRHLSSPELIAPFQDFPGYHEHFPSSSFFHIPREQFSK